MSMFMVSLFAILLLMLTAPKNSTTTQRKGKKTADNVLGGGTLINIYHGAARHTLSIDDDSTK